VELVSAEPVQQIARPRFVGRDHRSPRRWGTDRSSSSARPSSCEGPSRSSPRTWRPTAR